MRPPEGLELTRAPELDTPGLAGFRVRSETPIYDQLRVEFAVRQLVVQLTPMVENYRTVMRGVVEALQSAVNRAFERRAYSTPEATLARIRADQASLDWHETWRAEREAMGWDR